jgi:hypothetical protein
LGNKKGEIEMERENPNPNMNPKLENTCLTVGFRVYTSRL